ncbi:hypothetical protein BMS3Bbin01_00059 [bacterium BMS3Bbin01]|nr:hypothetical protein BMS3Bbin01_00059 [bacterium BMS3Bbin01]
MFGQGHILRKLPPTQLDEARSDDDAPCSGGRIESQHRQGGPCPHRIRVVGVVDDDRAALRGRHLPAVRRALQRGQIRRVCSQTDCCQHPDCARHIPRECLPIGGRTDGLPTEIDHRVRPDIDIGPCGTRRTSNHFPASLLGVGEFSELRMVDVQHECLRAIDDLGFRRGDRFERAESFEMDGADGGDHRYRWTNPLTQCSNLASPVGPHLGDEDLGSGRELFVDGTRQTQTVVEAGRADDHPAPIPQKSTDVGLRRGLAERAGDRDNRRSDRGEASRGLIDEAGAGSNFHWPQQPQCSIHEQRYRRCHHDRHHSGAADGEQEEQERGGRPDRTTKAGGPCEWRGPPAHTEPEWAEGNDGRRHQAHRPHPDRHDRSGHRKHESGEVHDTAPPPPHRESDD